MPATLLDNLVDDLVPVVDELRAELYDSMGIRQYEVHLVRRQWSGAERNDGTVMVLQDVILSPPPNYVDKLRFQMMSHGRDIQGDAILTEVSLTYSETDLTGGVLPANEEFFYKLVDMRGQGISPKYFVPNVPLTTDRERNLGWVIQLHAIAIEQP